MRLGAMRKETGERKGPLLPAALEPLKRNLVGGKYKQSSWQKWPQRGTSSPSALFVCGTPCHKMWQRPLARLA